MIIESALEIEHDKNYRVLPNNPYWHCISFNYEGKQYAIAFEENKFYGWLIRQFAIDGKWDTGVPDKYIEGKTVSFSECNSLCGERPFERDSIAYEFLLKPLGLEPLQYKGYQSVCYITHIKNWCERKNIEYHEWTY